MGEKIEMPGFVETSKDLAKKGIILPFPTNWEPLDDPDKLEKWGWKSNLDTEIFGRIKGFSSDGKPQYELILDEFNKGTSFLEFGKYLFGPLAEWLGAQIGENWWDTNIAAATAKRAGMERILNTPDRLLGIYILSTMLGNGGGVGGKPPEGYVGGGVGGEEKPPEKPPAYISKEEYEKLLKDIEAIKHYIDEDAIRDGIYIGQKALEEAEGDIVKAGWIIDSNDYLPEYIKKYAKTYIKVGEIEEAMKDIATKKIYRKVMG